MGEGFIALALKRGDLLARRGEFRLSIVPLLLRCHTRLIRRRNGVFQVGNLRAQLLLLPGAIFLRSLGRF